MSYLCANRYASYQTLSIQADATRASGKVPLAVFFDATGTTSATTTNPFGDLLYIWNFGDSGAGTFSNGARSGISKNVAYGPVAAHVYETAGTYTPTLTVFDGLAAQTYTLPDIVVSAWANDANTIAVSTSGDFTGAPAGSTQVTSSDFDTPGGTSLATSLNAGKRVLFCGGETFTASATTTYTGASGAYLGAYGTGSPIVNWTGAVSGTGFIRIGGTGTDLRIVGIEFDGTGTSGMIFMTAQNTAWSNILIMNNHVHDLAQYMNNIDWASSGGFGLFVSGNRFDSPDPTMTTDMVLPGDGSKVSILGNYFDNNNLGQQVVRSNSNTKVVISANTLQGAFGTSGNQKSTIDVRGNAVVTNVYAVVSDNRIYVKNGFSGVYTQEGGGTSLGGYYTNIERNYISDVTSAVGGSNGIVTNSKQTRVRNNVIDASNKAILNGITLRDDNSSGSIPSTDVHVNDNTLYTAQASGSFTGINVSNSGTVQGTGNTVQNNLIYSPSITATAVSDAGNIATKSNNTGNVGAVGTNPNFTSATPAAVADFVLTAGSYALQAGLYSIPVFDDAQSARRSYGNVQPEIDIGALQTTVN